MPFEQITSMQKFSSERGASGDVCARALDVSPARRSRARQPIFKPDGEGLEAIFNETPVRQRRREAPPLNVETSLVGGVPRWGGGGS